jgi:superfamily II DNA or RNA helicase
VRKFSWARGLQQQFFENFPELPIVKLQLGYIKFPKRHGHLPMSNPALPCSAQVNFPSSARSLADLSLSVEYRTGYSEPVSQFYTPCLAASVQYKRAVGYFRSSIYLMVGPALLNFARRGGKILLVCSPELTQEDQDAISEGYTAQAGRVSARMLEEVDALLSQSGLASHLAILATLIAVGRLEVKLAIRPPSHGLYHEKIGVFIDAEANLVSFIGSANESWSGWHERGNFESVEVFCSWKSPAERERTGRHQANFDDLWAGTTPNVLTMDFPEAARLKLCTRAASSLEDPQLLGILDQSEPADDPKKRTLLPHQSAAIKSWIEQGRRGVFEHATGSGKTFTALEAARQHIDSGMPALILLPSELLLKQWASEVRLEFPNVAVMLAGAGNDRWKDPGRLRRFSSPQPTSVGRIVLSTMQTAATSAFRQSLWHGEHLMFVADEVHQIGSDFNSRSMSITSGPRLGLSATPQRYGDEDGTARIFDYFGPVVPPPITLGDAVAAGRLVEYIYHPHPVRLNAEEAEAWKSITKSLRFELGSDREGGKAKMTERAKMLLIKRARIAKKAAAKSPLAAAILKKNYEEGQSWLIYCEDSDHLARTMEEIRAVGLTSIEYHSNMDGDRVATLDWFKQFGGILVSIKCLDEGVDIPSVSHAIILASSQNPRQFIQRRGRVLRKAGRDKVFATIHDAIVVPIGLDEEPEQGSLLKSEFLRAIEFAISAMNLSAGAELREIAREVGFDPDENLANGIEED